MDNPHASDIQSQFLEQLCSGKLRKWGSMFWAGRQVGAEVLHDGQAVEQVVKFSSYSIFQTFSDLAPAATIIFVPLDNSTLWFGTSPTHVDSKAREFLYS